MSAVVAQQSVRRRRRARGARTVTTAPVPVLMPWLRSQALNSTRHAAALRPFTRAEFGSDAAAPSEGHLQAANALITSLRRELLRLNEPVRATSAAAQRHPKDENLRRLLELKDQAHQWVRTIERIWDF